MASAKKGAQQATDKSTRAPGRSLAPPTPVAATQVGKTNAASRLGNLQVGAALRPMIQREPLRSSPLPTLSSNDPTARASSSAAQAQLAEDLKWLGPDAVPEPHPVSPAAQSATQAAQSAPAYNLAADAEALQVVMRAFGDVARVEDLGEIYHVLHSPDVNSAALVAAAERAGRMKLAGRLIEMASQGNDFAVLPAQRAEVASSRLEPYGLSIDAFEQQEVAGFIDIFGRALLHLGWDILDRTEAVCVQYLTDAQRLMAVAREITEALGPARATLLGALRDANELERYVGPGVDPRARKAARENADGARWLVHALIRLAFRKFAFGQWPEFPHLAEELLNATHPDEAMHALRSFFEDNLSAVREARAQLTLEKVWHLDLLVAEAERRWIPQGPSLYQQIIEVRRQRAETAPLKKIESVLAFAFMVVAIAVPASAPVLAPLSAVLGGLGAVGAILEYEEDSADYEVGFGSVKPSALWPFLAVFGAGVDLTVALHMLGSPAVAEAIKRFNASRNLSALSRELNSAEGLSPEVRDAIEQGAKRELAATTHPTSTTAPASPPSTPAPASSTSAVKPAQASAKPATSGSGRLPQRQRPVQQRPQQQLMSTRRPTSEEEAKAAQVRKVLEQVKSGKAKVYTNPDARTKDLLHVTDVETSKSVPRNKLREIDQKISQGIAEYREHAPKRLEALKRSIDRLDHAIALRERQLLDPAITEQKRQKLTELLHALRQRRTMLDKEQKLVRSELKRLPATQTKNPDSQIDLAKSIAEEERKRKIGYAEQQLKYWDNLIADNKSILLDPNISEEERKALTDEIEELERARHAAEISLQRLRSP